MHGSDVVESAIIGTELEEVEPRLAYDAAQVGFLLGGITERKVRQMIADKELPSFTVGTRRLVEHDDLVAYIKARKEAAAAAEAAAAETDR